MRGCASRNGVSNAASGSIRILKGILAKAWKNPLVRVILKDGSWNAIAPGQPLKGLKSTCNPAHQNLHLGSVSKGSQAS